jgi:hypothetical protein
LGEKKKPPAPLPTAPADNGEWLKNLLREYQATGPETVEYLSLTRCLGTDKGLAILCRAATQDRHGTPVKLALHKLRAAFREHQQALKNVGIL